MGWNTSLRISQKPHFRPQICWLCWWPHTLQHHVDHKRCWLLWENTAFFSKVQKTEAGASSKTLQTVGDYSYHSALQHVTQDHNLSFHHCDKLKSHLISWLVFRPTVLHKGEKTGLWDHLAVCVCMHTSILNHITNFHEAWYKYKAIR
jgi:hypothetical protein